MFKWLFHILIFATSSGKYQNKEKPLNHQRKLGLVCFSSGEDFRVQVSIKYIFLALLCHKHLWSQMRCTLRMTVKNFSFEDSPVNQSIYTMISGATKKTVTLAIWAGHL